MYSNCSSIPYHCSVLKIRKLSLRYPSEGMFNVQVHFKLLSYNRGKPGVLNDPEDPTSVPPHPNENRIFKLYFAIY